MIRRHRFGGKNKGLMSSIRHMTQLNTLLLLAFVLTSCAGFASDEASAPSAEVSSDQRVSQDGGDTPAEPRDVSIRFRGVPAVYGSEPRTYIAIEVRNEGSRKALSYFVHPDYQEPLRSLTGTLLVFTGVMYSGEQGFLESRFHDGVFVPESWETPREP